MSTRTAVREFMRSTYQSGSPIPYIISTQVILFVLVHIFDLLVDTRVIGIPLYDYTFTYLSLPADFLTFVRQPWSLVTYPFLYQGIFQLVFDSLWLYWCGTMFLNFLNKQQLLTLYFGSLLIGAIAYLFFGQISFLTDSPHSLLYTGTLGLGALVSFLTLLAPKMEVRLFLFGQVRFLYVALVFHLLQITYYWMSNKVAAAAYVCAIGIGMGYVYLLNNGYDPSRLFTKKKRRHLKVVSRTPEKVMVTHASKQYDDKRVPNQEEIDQILDKISLTGYESLSRTEKEILFRASKQEN